MANFFARQPIPLTPNPEPAGYDVLRYMLMNRAMGQMANPYGLSPGGMQNFGGFNQGNKPFNPYGEGFGPGGPTGGGGGAVGPTMGGGGGMMGGGGGMPPQLMMLLQQLLGGGGGGARPPVSPIPAPRAQPISMRTGVTTPQTGQVGGSLSQPSSRTTMPINQQAGGYDGTTVGYGGFPVHQPQSVMALMRALGQVPRPHMMAPQQAHPMGAMMMPGMRRR